MIKAIYIIVISILPLTFVSAENNQQDFFNNIGKINVVVGVIVIIFIGIVTYLIRLERKITSLENKVKK